MAALNEPRVVSESNNSDNSTYSNHSEYSNSSVMAELDTLKRYIKHHNKNIYKILSLDESDSVIKDYLIRYFKLLNEKHDGIFEEDDVIKVQLPDNSNNSNNESNDSNNSYVKVNGGGRRRKTMKKRKMRKSKNHFNFSK